MRGSLSSKYNLFPCDPSRPFSTDIAPIDIPSALRRRPHRLRRGLLCQPLPLPSNFDSPRVLAGLTACPAVCPATPIYASFARHSDSMALSTPRSTSGGFSGDAVSASALPPPSAMRQYGTSGLTRALTEQARYDPAEALPVLEEAYGSLDAPFLARIDALVSRHLRATRPEVMSATFANRKMKRYSRDIEPRQADVGLCSGRGVPRLEGARPLSCGQHTPGGGPKISRSGPARE